MPATDTEQPPDTTPPSPAAAGKAGKRASAPAAQEPAPAAEPDTPEAPEQDAVPEPEPAAPGWFRNTAATPLTVIPHLYPSKTLAPGEATWLPDDPRHPDLKRCDAPAPDAPAADTAGSEQ